MNHRSLIASLLAIFVLVPLVGVVIGWGAWQYASHMTQARRDATISTHVVTAPLHTGLPSTGVRSSTVAMSAESLYAVYCAQCHGPNGDGNGTQKLDRPARSFKDGGFSFGNTTTALFRTISNGIGGTPMPGFANSLSADDRRALAAYVQSLGPPVIEVSNADMILTVDDTPQVVRGHLPALGAELPEHPRGLLIGTTDGLSFEYRADDVRLLAVRQGDFVERTDWTGRGGTPLNPLGNVIDIIDDGRPDAMIHLGSDTTARLLGTSVMDGRAVLRYSIESPADPDAIIDVEEWCEAAQTTVGSGYRRHLNLNIDGDVGSIALRLPGGSSGTLLETEDDAVPAIWTSRRSDGQYRIVVIETEADITRNESPTTAGGISLPGQPEHDIRLTTLILPDWNDDVMAALRKELAR
jgi:cytochrome c553